MKFSILGAGSWGTAFAKLLVENGHEVLIWARRGELADQINKYHANDDYLPNVRLPETLIASSDISSAVHFSDNLVIAVPTKYVDETMAKIERKPAVIVNLSKGIDEKLRTISSIVKSRWRDADYLVLSGPCHAVEVAKRLPTSVVIAGPNSITEAFQQAFSNDYFRVYVNDDVLGVEICGAVKNVIAIAAGILDGLGQWHNAKAALITRGLQEIARFGLSLGARSPLTFMGLAGMGDLIVTCTSPYSRNRYVGEMIGKGMALKDILSQMKMVAEGVYTVGPLLRMADSLHIDMPICRQVYDVLFRKKDPYQAISELMSRPLKMEIDLTQIGPESDL